MAAERSPAFREEKENIRINDEIKIAKNIITQSEKKYPKDEIVTRDTEISMLRFYTGVEVPESFCIYKISKSYSDWFHDSVTHQSRPVFLPYEHLRKAIYNEYVNKLKLPNRYTLIQELLTSLKRNEIPMKVLDKYIKEYGFIWKRVGKLKRYIIIEKTEQMQSRMRYLYQMQQIREANKVIVHVALQSINLNNENNNIDVGIAVSPQLGLIDAHVTKSGKESINIDKRLNDKLYGLPDDTVFVVEQSSKLHDDGLNLFTEYSKKESMMAWLRKKQIPFDPESHRADFLTLIKEHQRLHGGKLLDCFPLLSTKRYKILFRPNLSSKSVFLDLWNDLEKIDPEFMDEEQLLSKYLEIITDVGDDIWIDRDREVADYEQETLTEDLKLELVLDKLMESIKNHTLQEADFENCEKDVADSVYLNSIIKV